jgi:Core-2/I-Branching enzyme
VTLAYIVVAHTAPRQVVRMVRALDGESVRFLVHVDRKASDAAARAIRDGLAGLDVTYLPRHVCHWGGFGIVAATLEGIGALARGGRPFDYAVLLSGQDYPIKPPETISAFFAAAGGRSFLDAAALPSARFGGGGGLDRLERMHWSWTVRGRRLYVPNRYVRLSPRRRLPQGVRPYAGSAWWALSRAAVEVVDESVRSRPALVEFMRRAQFPDESLFQMIVMESPLARTVESDDLHYVDWSGDGRSPKVLTVADLPRLREATDLYARKFDERVDAEVLDRVDAELLGRAA